MKLSLSAALLCGVMPLAVSASPLSLVITPTRTETPVSEIGSSVSVLTAQDMKMLQVPTVRDALKYIPGLSIATNGGAGQTTSVFIRGAKSEHTLVMIDGVKINDPSSTTDSYDFGRLTTANIERIEVLRGSQSVLYGADAIGGVINIITKQGSGVPSFTSSAEYGSRNHYILSTGASGSVDALRYSADISQQHVDGFSAFNRERGGIEDDGNETTTYSGRLDGKIDDRLRAYTTGRYTRSYTEFDDFGADADNDSKANELNWRGAAVLDLMGGKWSQELGLSYLDGGRSSTSSFGTNRFQGKRTKLDWVHTVKPIAGHILTGGLESSEETFSTDFDASRSVRNDAAFAQDQWNVWDKLFFTAGVRVDDHEEFGTEWTYRIAPSYLIESTGTRFKASYGTGFKAPSLFQLYSFFGNTALDPERSKSWDAGFEQSLLGETLRFGSTYFGLRVNDLIDYDFATNRYINTGSAKSQGFESFISYAPLPEVTFSLNHTFTLAEDRITDTELLRRPRHTFSVEANWQAMEDVRLGMNATYQGARQDIDLAFDRTRMGGYPLLNVTGDWNVLSNVTVFGRIENLLDREYENVFGYGTAGLSGFAGVRAQY
jgi:vitamin B12 transporter